MKKVLLGMVVALPAEPLSTPVTLRKILLFI
jgi:hypothetical protein